MKRFQKILVANRGEIALRVMRTCRQMGLATVAVYSDADERSPHVKFADEAVRLGPAPSSESYLVPERILEAAARTGAEAVHPGYGFLAESSRFAQACVQAGLVFIGPSPQAIAAMGSKIGARRLMAEHGVPVTPGYNGEDQSDKVLHEKILEIGFPVIVKASAGGGGKGMVLVRGEGEIAAALESARRMALGAFGDETLLLEKYVSPVRHVEVQILGDTRGTLVHVFERECSIQRRHQKIIEETPSPALTPALREAMGAAAVKAGQAIGYTSAGTVEFLLDLQGRFYFLEVNTRLQVEHPVTEMVTGLDLVRLQILVAMGEPLPFRQEDLRQSGHAIECRLYAEDPARDFLPSTGTLHDWAAPEMPGLRIDAGVEAGSEVSIFYDPLLAKVVTHGPTRSEAIARMVRALGGLSVAGVRTNRQFLVQVLEHPEFGAGRLSTHFIEEHLPIEARGQQSGPEAVAVSALAAVFHDHERRRTLRKLLPGVPSGYRNSPFRAQSVVLRHGEHELRVEYRAGAVGQFTARVAGGPEQSVQVLEAGQRTLRLAVGGVQRTFRVVRVGETVFVHSGLGSVELALLSRFPETKAQGAEKSCVSPMPGRIRRVLVAAGQRVEAGAPLVILEAMKMEHTVAAPAAGLAEEILVAEGQQVQAGAELIRFVPDPVAVLEDKG